MWNNHEKFSITVNYPSGKNNCIVLWIWNPSTIPPHLGVSVGNIYAHAQVGKVEFKNVTNLISQIKRAEKKVLFVELQLVGNEIQLESVFNQFKAIQLGESTCLTPILKILKLDNQFERIHDVLDFLIEKKQVKAIYLSENNVDFKGIPFYTRKDIENEIRAISKGVKSEVVTEISLRKVNESDIDVLFEWENSLEAKKITTVSQEITKEFLKEFVIQTQSLEEFGQIRWMIETSTEIIGCLDIHNFSVNEQSAEVGIVIFEQENRSKSLGFNALSQLEKKVEIFQNIKLLRAFVQPKNVISVKLFEKSGYKKVKSDEKNTYFHPEFKEELVVFEKWLKK